MTDETTARGRAIEDLVASIDWDPTCLPGRERHAIVDQVLRLRALAGAPTADVADELEEHFIEANERLGDALVQIGMALGLPRPTAQNTWGAPEILAKLRAAALEGVDAADERAAAQTVVGAARDLVNHEIRPSAFPPFTRLEHAVRALDGDTTKEA